MITAVLDVDVLVAAILAPHGTTRQVLAAWEANRFQSLTSEGIVAEVEEKLRSPRIGGRYGVTLSDIEWVRGLLLTQSKVIDIIPQDVIPSTGDPEDDYVLATARVGQADYLVTGDRGLLSLQNHHGTSIVAPREFLGILARA
jgi:putative PIN family toxin of toxin-antitoxin system